MLWAVENGNFEDGGFDAIILGYAERIYDLTSTNEHETP
jgi:hypothetical protein